MIRNVVFDLGNVLISFRPDIFLKEKNYPENKQKAILADIFGGEEWLLLDKGVISTEIAIESISSKSSLSRREIASVFNKRTDIMFPLNQNIKILPELKKRGLGLYYLSNFPGDIFPAIKSSFPFFSYFDGGIISAEVKLIKPDPDIYRLFLVKYDLKPEECLYIDDIEINVKTAETTGMKGVHFQKENSLQEIADLLPCFQ